MQLPPNAITSLLVSGALGRFLLDGIPTQRSVKAERAEDKQTRRRARVARGGTRASHPTKKHRDGPKRGRAGR